MGYFATTKKSPSLQSSAIGLEVCAIIIAATIVGIPKTSLARMVNELLTPSRVADGHEGWECSLELSSITDMLLPLETNLVSKKLVECN